jgi:hypothetical protein
MRFRSSVLWASLAAYLTARLSQLYAGTLPGLVIVLFHVVPPAVFALVHGSILYRVKGMMIFTACCLGVGGFAESRKHHMNPTG